jgi:1-acyl-sn-glycerol-3-phosphate acyltransferase
MQWLGSLLFAALFYPGTLLFVLASFPATLAGRGPLRAVVHGWARFHALLASGLLGIRGRVEGTLPSGVHLIAVKHQAMFETLEILRIADTPVVVLKRELSDLPLFGWVTRRYGVIPVDRGAGAKALREMLGLGRRAIAEGRPLVIFPEGTRVPPGETPPLRPGFAGLYRMLGLPVVPIAVDSGRLWGRGLLKRRGTITFRIGEPIPAGLKRQEIEARVHAAINALEPSAAQPRP